MTKSIRFQVLGYKVRINLIGNFKSKPHPFWFARKYSTMATVQSGPFEVFVRKTL